MQNSHEHFGIKISRCVEVVGIAVIVSAIMLLSLMAFGLWRESTKWNPLAEYPILLVQDTNPDNDIKISDNPYSDSPVFYWDENITYNGVKCVKHDAGKVTINGTVNWVSDLPPGRTIEIGGDINTRGPGCQQYQFKNPIPENVIDAMRAMKEDGRETSVWHLTGTETPFKKDGESGESRSWLTTTFTVIHRDAP